MTSYRRNFIPGGSFFFTINLADRKLSLYPVGCLEFKEHVPVQVRYVDDGGVVERPRVQECMHFSRVSATAAQDH